MNNLENPTHQKIFKTNLQIEVAGIKIPITFKIDADRQFSFDNKDHEEELSIEGMIGTKIARINHIHIPNKLRKQGIAKTLLTEIEKQLALHGIHTTFATFSKTTTIDFFLHHGYRVVPLSTLSPNEQKYTWTEKILMIGLNIALIMMI